MQVDIKLQKINPTIWWWVVGRWVGQGQDHKLKKTYFKRPNLQILTVQFKVKFERLYLLNHWTDFKTSKK